jgi:hypothetical protein
LGFSILICWTGEAWFGGCIEGVTMRPGKHGRAGSSDLFRARLDQITCMRHALVLLAAMIDWAWIESGTVPLYSGKGRPGIEARFAIGLHICGLSDEGVCERWVYDPISSFSPGKSFSGAGSRMSARFSPHWRKRFGAKLDLLPAESLRVARQAGAPAFAPQIQSQNQSHIIFVRESKRGLFQNEKGVTPGRGSRPGLLVSGMRSVHCCTAVRPLNFLRDAT